jgi:hypothetical protein
MKVTSALVAMSVTIAAPTGAADPGLRDREGAAVSWSAWIDGSGPAAVVVFASWSPRSDEVLLVLDDLEATARSRELGFVVLSVQEPFDDARASLESTGVDWLHDRHGMLLKRYRVLRIPSVLVIARDGTLLATLDATADALRSGDGW